jgi:Tol biopolymer transport system component
MFLRTVVDSNIWRLKVGGDGKLERLIASDRRDLNPDYSPDGKRIAFVSDRGGTQQLWVADTDGTNAVALTTDAVLPAAPRWSPDGKWVAFAARPKGNVDVYATPASGGAVKRLTQHPSEDASARYSRDGKWIYFASNRTGRREVWRKPADGTGDETQITRNGGWVSRESKDGQWLFYTKFGMGPGVFRIKLPAGEEQKVIEADPESAWALENDELYFADKGFDGYRKWNPATRIVSVAARMGFPALRGPTGLSVSPDGQWLLIWKVDANISEILMMEGVK